MKVYTRTGDHGGTSLLSGGRVAKNHARIDAYGTVDELNTVLGVLRAEPLPAGVEARIHELQETLFEVGSALADADGVRPVDPERWSAGPLEEWIDGMEGELPELRSFILPGGCRASAVAHLARTVCRRAERAVVGLAQEHPVADGIVPFLNRTSDCLFVLARFLNARLGVPDVIWRSGGANPDDAGER